MKKSLLCLALLGQICVIAPSCFGMNKQTVQNQYPYQTQKISNELEFELEQNTKLYGKHTATLLGIEKVLDNKQLLILLQDKGFSVIQPFLSFSSEDIIDFIKTTLKINDLDGKKIKQKFKKFANNLNQQMSNSFLFVQKQLPLINEINTFISEVTTDGNAMIVVSLANETNQQIITHPTVKNILQAIGSCIETYLSTKSTYKVFIPVLLQAKPSRQDEFDTKARDAIKLTSLFIAKFFGKPINFDVVYNQSTKTISIMHTKQYTPVSIKNQEFIEKITPSPNPKFQLINSTELEYIAQDSFITKLRSLTLRFNPDFINKKRLSKIEKLFQNNMHPDAKIILNNTIITKNQIKKSEMQNVKNKYTKNYCIHVMWINRCCDNFFACNKEKTDMLISCVLGWAKNNSDAKIFIWYDSNFITKPEAAIQYIKKSIENKQHQIIFKDIRELEIVKNHVSVFSEKLPVYFRVDLLREIIAYEMLIKNETRCFVYADIDIKPITKDELFDEKTVFLLKKYGIVVPRMQGASSINPYENGFQMITLNNTGLAAIKTILVDVNIAVAESFLNPSTPEQQKTKRLFGQMYSTRLQQHVYKMFLVMFKYLHFLNGVALSTSEISITGITQEAINNYWDGEVTNTLSNITPKIGFSWFFPLKEIDIPPPQVNYY